MSSGPAVAVGLAFTLKVTSSNAVPQGGVVLLVVVILKVTVPIPATLTVDVGEPGVATVACAVPV